MLMEFLKLDINGMIRTQRLTDVKEEFSLRGHLRLLSAVKLQVVTL